jgi:hypothetical protein
VLSTNRMFLNFVPPQLVWSPAKVMTTSPQVKCEVIS